MNNLEEQLRSALRRKDPSPDFIQRVVSSLPATRDKKPSWWARMLSRTRPTLIQWVAVGAVAVLLIAIGIGRYIRPGRVDRAGGTVAAVSPSPQPAPNQVPDTRVTQPKTDRGGADRMIPGPALPAPGSRHVRSAQQRMAEGERATEQLKLALYIASAKLNAAERKVNEDLSATRTRPASSREPVPEPMLR